MKAWSSETSVVALDWLASPLVWWAGGLLLFATMVRWRTLHRLRGGMLLAVALLTLLGLVASQAATRTALLVPTRLEVLLFLCINAFALWLALHERLAAATNEGNTRPAAGQGISTAELWLATAAVVGVLAAAFVWGVPPTNSEATSFFHGEMQLRAFLAPWVAELLLPCLLLATLVALPWLHRPAGEDPVAEPVPPNTGLIFCGLAWLLLVLIPMAVAAFENLPMEAAGGSSAPATDTTTDTTPVRTLAQLFWLDVVETEMPSPWPLRESPGIVLLLFYFVLLPFLLPRLRASRGFCRRCHKALGAPRYTVLLALVLIFSLVPLKMVSHWWLGLGEWVSIPELPFHF